jgi:NADPH:quinone reductase
MRAWRVCELGDPEEALKLEEVEDPSPEPGEVVVEVEAAALNFFDILLCRGEYQERPELPFTLGAEVAIDYREENFVEVVKEATEGLGADVIFDPVGGDVFDASRRCVAFEGRIVVIGFTGGRIAEAPTNHLLVKNYSVVGLHWGLYGKVRGHLVREAHEELMRLYEGGRIDPLVGEVVLFKEVPQALMLLGSRSTRGKIVTRPGA